MWTLLVRDQWTLWPPTPVTLATLSLEVPPLGLVGVMECGVGQQLQCVSVIGIEFYSLHVECMFTKLQELVLIYHHQ